MKRLWRIPTSLPVAGGLILLGALFVAAMPVAVQSGAYGVSRAESGARLFRAMLAADLDLEKKLDVSGALRVLIVHAGDADRAMSLGGIVEGRDARKTPEAIRGLPVRVETIRVEDVPGARPTAGIFIAEPLKRQALASLIRFGADHRVIVFSPFEGDVENGVAGGLLVEAQVRPFVNTEALRAAQVTLKEFFLKVAKAYP